MAEASSRRLRIAHVASYFPSHTGGLEIAAWNIARATAERGTLVDFFACGSSSELSVVPGLIVHQVGFVDPLDRRFGMPMPVWSPRSMAALARAVRRADIVHTHDTLYFSSVLSAVLARWYARPLLVTVHVSELKFRSRVLSRLFHVATRLVGRRVLEAATKVAYVGSTAEAFYAGRASFRAPPVVIPNGADRECFRPLCLDDRRRQRLSLGLPIDGPVFLFVGRFVEKKGLPLLFSAVRDLPRVTWVFVGEGPLDPAAWGLPNVVTPGRLDQARVASFYQVADLVVSPGVGEGGITLVVQEAMSCGSPVLVSREVAAAFGDSLPAGVWAVDTGIEDASSRLSQELGRLASEPHQLAAVRDAVAVHSLRWNWASTADAYQGVYRSLVTRGDAASPGPF